MTYGPNAMDIDFEKLMAQAGDEELKNMHLYFSSLEPSSKNEHTGKFEGYNLVFITAEAFSRYAVDEDVTPTLFKLSREGYHFTNFYTPIWGVSTSDGEYVATTGLIPKSGVGSMLKSGSNSMPFAMGNQLAALGYKTLDNLAGHEVDSRFELHQSSLIMYAEGMEPEVINEPVSSLDIMPALQSDGRRVRLPSLHGA